MVTTKFIAAWFIFSFCIFLTIKALYGKEEIERDWNAAIVLFSQGFGALLAYALH